MSMEPIEKGKEVAPSTDAPESTGAVSEVQAGKARATDDKGADEDEDEEYNEEEDEDFVRLQILT